MWTGKIRRWIAAVCLMSLCAAMASGCGSNGGEKGTGEEAVGLSAEELLDADWETIEAQVKEEGKVVFFAWSDEEFWITIKNAFEEKYGIEMDVVIADKSKGVDKAMAEKDGAQGSFDLMLTGGQDVQRVIDSELMAGPAVPKMRVADKLDQQLCQRVEGVETNGYLVPAKTNQTGLLYNPRTVENPPKTWEELEKWIDENPMKFGFCVPEKGGSGQAFVHSALDVCTGGLDQYYGDTALDESKLESWGAMWDWFNERKDKITLTASNNDSISRLNQGELDLVVAWDDNAFRVMQNGELFADAEMYIPEFGMPGGGDVLGVLKNAAHPAAAWLLMDFMVSDEGQQLFIDVLNCGPARTDMVNPNTFLSEEDLEHRVSWVPAVYKTEFIKQFTAEVMMSK